MGVTHETSPLTAVEMDQLSINTIRTLAIDAIERAKSGHPRQWRWHH